MKNYRHINLTLKGKGKYKLLVADTVNKKNKGLKGVTKKDLGFKTGMIFVYDYDVSHNFTMIGVKIPLIMYFLDKDCNVIKTIFAKPGIKIVNPGCNYRYVIEIPA